MFRPSQLIRRLVLAMIIPLIGVIFAVACSTGTSSSDKTSTAAAGSKPASTTAPGAPSKTSAAGAKLPVVAAENFWASIASQLGGDRVTVTAIISSPDTDPHIYEARPSDGRAIASANYVIYNGLGYDPWVGKALDANRSSGRAVLKVQDLLGLKDDDNPHRWYSPGDVAKVIDQIVADYKKLDAADASYFDAQKNALAGTGLKQYNDLVAQTKQKYAGTPIGATESIVSPLADALGLKLITPAGFLRAISDGTDPTAQDKATFDSQIANKQISVLLFNTQNATPDVQQLVDAAKARGIAVVDVTETLEPPEATFQDWQSKQLQDLATALAQATGH